MEVEDQTQDFNLSPEERAKLGLDLQRVFIDYWHQADMPENNGFLEYFKDEYDIHWKKAIIMIDRTFGSYSDLIRSMGETPNSNRRPQGAAADIYRDENVMPETHKRLRKLNRSYITSSAEKVAGSHSATIEALGLFEEYLNIIDERMNGSSPQIEEMLERRNKDRETLIEALEEKTGKAYEEMETKYEVS